MQVAILIYRFKNYNYNEGFGIEYRQSKSYKYVSIFYIAKCILTTKLKQIIFAGITFNKYYNNIAQKFKRYWSQS